MSSTIEDAAEDAIRIAWNVERPVTVQSLSVSTVQSRYQAKGTILFVLYVLGAALIVLVPAAVGGRSGYLWTLALLALAVAGGWLVRWTLARWVAEKSEYVDPEIVVTVSSDGVAIASPMGDFHIALDAVEATLTYTRSENLVSFRGMDIKTPIGLLALDNDGFERGREAAAAIVQEMAWAREGRARDRQERMI